LGAAAFLFAPCCFYETMFLFKNKATAKQKAMTKFDGILQLQVCQLCFKNGCIVIQYDCATKTNLA